MKTEKDKNLVAGRLNGTFGVEDSGAPGVNPKPSSYGNVRLGLTADEAIDPDQATAGSVEDPQADEKITAAELLLGTPDRSVAQQDAEAYDPDEDPIYEQEEIDADQETPEDTQRKAIEILQKKILVHLPYVVDRVQFWKHGRRSMVLGGSACVATILVIFWLIWAVGGGQSVTPKQASAAHQQHQVTPTSPEEHPPAPSPKSVPWRVVRPKSTLPLRQRLAKVFGLTEFQPGTTLRQPRLPQRTPRPVVVGPISSNATAGKTPKTKPPIKTPPKDADVQQYVSAPAGLKVTGIVQLANGKYANINGYFVTIGEVVEGARVVRILDFAVEMERDGDYFLVGVNSQANGGNPAK